MQTTKAIIRITNFSENFRSIRTKIGPDRRICVPVKADAYGHGSLRMAEAAFEAGAYCVAVATASEGAILRSGGISGPILLFTQFLYEMIPVILDNRLIPLVSDRDSVDALNVQAIASGMKLPVHLKINSGMGRMGVSPADAPALARHIYGCAGLEYAGTATHLACSDSPEPADIAYTQQQLACFNDVIAAIRGADLDPGIVHAANSGAVLLHPESWLDMVRPGILLYGYKQVDDAHCPQGTMLIRPLMEMRSKISFVRNVRQGESISYGRTWTAPCDTAIGVIPAGYADGLPRLASNRWQVSINGQLYPLVGRICMDQCMVDLGSDPTVRRWDDVSIFGGPAPDAAVLAERIGTIPYEITCNVNKRVPRIYEE